MFLQSLEFFWQLRIADSVAVEIHYTDPNTVLHFAFAGFVQKRTPLRVVLQVVGDTFREQNVSGVATIHYPLGDVNTRAGDVRLLVQVRDFVNGAAVNSHAHPQLGMLFQRLRDFDRALHRRF